MIEAAGFTATKCVTAGTTAVPAAGTVGVTDLPSTLASVAASRIASTVYGGFSRDAAGNILVEFAMASRPTDGSQCWLYDARSNYWDQKA